MFEPRWHNKELNWILENSRQIETPFFLLSEDKLEHNIAFLKKKLGKKFAVCFSVKANPWYAAAAAKYADYVEVCSRGEWELCTKQGIPADKVAACGVYKSDLELKGLIESRPHRISIESMLQMEQAAKHAYASGMKTNILLRVSSGNQFGMDLDQVIEILNHQDRFPSLQIKGIHYYSGTQKRQRKEIDADITLLEAVGNQTKGNFTEIEYGPGLGVPQFQSHMPEEYDLLLSGLIERLQPLAENFRVTLECGRLLTADTGIYITEIVDQKINNGRMYYIVDGGIHHLQYYGQIKGQQQPYIYAGEEKGIEESREVTVCGALCTANDVLIRSVQLPAKKLGDRIVFLNAGAYCTTEGISLFLSRDLPGIVIKKQKELAAVRDSAASYPFNMRMLQG